MSQLEALGIRYDYDGELETAQLNQERVVTAVQIALDKLQEYGHTAAVRWFQYEYSRAIERLNEATEAEVFSSRNGLPSLTGHENS